MGKFTLFALFFLTLLLPGCVLPPKATNPMEAIWLEKESGNAADTLFVLLPGRRDSPEDFLKYRFVDHFRASGIEGDIVLPDAHLGYYYERVFRERLQNDIIEVAREKGYERIWAVGISLGGFGAVMFERDEPGTWEGIVLIAPFAGDDDAVLESVLAADSLEDVPFKPELTEDDYTARFWEWMRRYEADPSLPVFLGYGSEDRMQAEQARIAKLLPAEQVFVIPGKHLWPVWEELWQRMLPEISEAVQETPSSRERNSL